MKQRKTPTVQPSRRWRRSPQAHPGHRVYSLMFNEHSTQVAQQRVAALVPRRPRSRPRLLESGTIERGVDLRSQIDRHPVSRSNIVCRADPWCIWPVARHPASAVVLPRNLCQYPYTQRLRAAQPPKVSFPSDSRIAPASSRVIPHTSLARRVTIPERVVPPRLLENPCRSKKSFEEYRWLGLLGWLCLLVRQCALRKLRS